MKFDLLNYGREKNGWLYILIYPLGMTTRNAGKANHGEMRFYISNAAV